MPYHHVNLLLVEIVYKMSISRNFQEGERLINNV